MLKKIRNVFEYKDYRVLLNHDFLMRSSANEKYSLRAYSRDLRLSTSFISDVLRGRKEISPRKARQTFQRLGFKLEELDYVESLVAYSAEKDPILKQSHLQKINQKFKHTPVVADSNKHLIMKSVDHFILHGIIGGEARLQEIQKIARILEISDERTVEVIEDFLGEKYVRKEADGSIFINHMNIQVTDHEHIFTIQQQFVERLIRGTVQLGGNKMPERMGNFFVMGFDQERLPLAAEAYRQFVNTIIRLSNQSETAERFGFLSLNFLTVPRG